MPATTPIYALPYQGLSDPPHGPDLGENLALAVEAQLARIDAAAAADVTAWRPLLVVKGVGETVDSATTGTTLQDDNELFLDLVGGRTYEVVVQLSASAETLTPDIKIAYTSTGTMVLRNRATLGPETALTTVNATLMGVAGRGTLATVAPVGLSTGETAFREVLLVECTVSGRLQLQWAQNTLSADDTTMRSGSYMHARRLA